MGDAQHMISVDGTPIGATLTAHASHKLGQENIARLRGSWGARSHVVTVNFLNDAWDATTGGYRNLYVRGMSYNSKAIADTTAELLPSGPRDFSILPVPSAITPGGPVNIGSKQ